MAEAYIIDAVRTPMGRKKGSLAAVHPADLAAHPIRELFRRNDVDPGAVDDCVWGCCDTIGPQAGDIGRTAWLVAGLPQHVPGVRFEPAGGAFRSTRSNERDTRTYCRRRQPGDECDPDLGRHVCRPALWFR